MTENYLITSLKLKTSFIFLVCVALVGCIGNNNPTVEPFQPSSVLTYDKPIALESQLVGLSSGHCQQSSCLQSPNFSGSGKRACADYQITKRR